MPRNYSKKELAAIHAKNNGAGAPRRTAPLGKRGHTFRGHNLYRKPLYDANGRIEGYGYAYARSKPEGFDSAEVPAGYRPGVDKEGHPCLEKVN